MTPTSGKLPNGDSVPICGVAQPFVSASPSRKAPHATVPGSRSVAPAIGRLASEPSRRLGRAAAQIQAGESRQSTPRSCCLCGASRRGTGALECPPRRSACGVVVVGRVMTPLPTSAYHDVRAYALLASGPLLKGAPECRPAPVLFDTTIRYFYCLRMGTLTAVFEVPLSTPIVVRGDGKPLTYSAA